MNYYLLAILLIINTIAFLWPVLSLNSKKNHKILFFILPPFLTSVCLHLVVLQIRSQPQNALVLGISDDN